MATTMLKIAWQSPRIASRSVCLSSQRFAHQEFDERVQNSVAREGTAPGVSDKSIADEAVVEDVPDLYPKLRGKYPPGSVADGTGWEGLTSQEAWKWNKQRRLIESYTANVAKKLSFLAKKPIKTWKFPPVQWGSGSLNYIGDRTKTSIINEDDFFNTLKYPETTEQSEVIAPILLDTLRLDSKVQRSKLEERFNKNKLFRHSMKYAPPSFENIKSHLRTKCILNTIISVAQSGLLGKLPHLENCAIDENVRVAAQWSRHGVQRHAPFKPSKRKLELPNNALFYGEHMVDFHIRTHLPLSEFYDREDRLCRQCTYPKSPYKPTALGHRSVSMQRPVCPGFNLGAPHEFTHLNVVHTDERQLAKAIKEYGREDKTMMGYALATNFFSAVAMAHTQGFNMLSEITYPFCTQTLLTNGQTFIFSAYQLNTLHMWRSDEGNNRQNLFWVSQPHRLYEVDENGAIENINMDTLGKLLKLMLLPTSDRREGLSPRLPYKPAPGKISMTIPHRRYKKKKVIIKEVY